MSYLNDVFFCNPNKNSLYKFTNDAIATGYPVGTGANPMSVLVATDMSRVLVANYADNTVSVFKNGVLQRNVDVGKRPIGICESHDGNFYVTNFASNNVTKINGSTYKTSTIPVGKSPRGVCCSNDGTVYVANYASGTVTKIYNDLVVDTIKVGRGPSGICVDRNDAVWVTNIGSHTISKISKIGHIVATVQINGASPYAICNDISGNKWVTGYASGMVYKIVGTSVANKIVVGSKPTAVAVNDSGQVYVFNSQDGTITKIKGSTVVDTIKSTTSYISADFGDPTGFQAWYLFKYSGGGSSSGGTIADGSVTFQKLDSDLQDMVEKASANADATKYMVFVLNEADTVGPSPVELTIPFKATLDAISMSVPAESTITNPVKVGVEYFSAGAWKEFDEVEITSSDASKTKLVTPTSVTVDQNTIIRCNLKTAQAGLKNINVLVQVTPVISTKV